MVAPAVATTTLKHLHNLVAHAQHLHEVTERWPAAAAREMALAVQHDWQREQDPYGQAWKKVRMSRSKLGGLTRRFDPKAHVMHGWQPYTNGPDAMIVGSHHASAALQPKDPTKRHFRRLMHPIEGEGLGLWGPRMEREMKKLLYGARLGEIGREKLKFAATSRRQGKHLARVLDRAAKHEAKNRERIAAGKKPLKMRAIKMRKVRSDRARVDRIVVRALGGQGG